MIYTSKAALLLKVFLTLLIIAGSVSGQGTTFTYQGRLTDGGTPANGPYDLQFKLYDAGGIPQGPIVTRDDVLVTNGVFTVQLDFGNQFNGGERLIEIAVRPGSGTGSDPYTILSPRQSITATPYAIRSLSAVQADQLSVACVTCVSDGAISSLSGNKVTGSVASANSAINVSGMVGVVNGGTGLNSAGAGGNFLRSDGSNWMSAPLSVSDVPDLGGSYVRNSTSQQPVSNFNISGSGTAGGTLSGTTVNAAAQYNFNGNRVLFVSGSIAAPNSNTFTGIGAGAGASNVGVNNSFYGLNAGGANSNGGNNSFFGARAGEANTSGLQNSFFGYSAGRTTVSGSNNSFFGNAAGTLNTASDNSFFGTLAGRDNSTGQGNAFFGRSAGRGNQNGDNNSFFGSFAGDANTTGNDNAFFGSSAGAVNGSGNNNAFFGREAGSSNTASGNSFFGRRAGRNTSSGSNNSFFGETAGDSNSMGTANSFFGRAAGGLNTTGERNTYIGSDAGFAIGTGSDNTMIGVSSGGLAVNGNANTFIGGSTNSTSLVHPGNNNSLLGANAVLGAENLSFATAIGSGAVVSTSNTVVLGRAMDAVQVPGNLNVSGTISGGVSAGSISGVLPTANGGTGLSLPGPSGNILKSDGTNWTSVALSDVPVTGNYIQNTATQQPSSNFNISGDGTAGGTLAGNVVSATTQYNIGADRVLSVVGFENTFTGIFAGLSNAGESNSFYGFAAGQLNINGDDNSFFGWAAGNRNTTGSSNSFFGFGSGQSNLTGAQNAFFGTQTGLRNTEGRDNSFFGWGAGRDNTTGSFNSFFGEAAGASNHSGSVLTLIGDRADVGADGLTNATAIGAGAVVTQSDSLVLGDEANVGIGTTAPKSRLHVATGYVQIPVKLTAGAPPAADCNSDDVAGRMILVVPDDRLYVCTGTAGWKAAALVP